MRGKQGGLNASAAKVQQALDEFGLALHVVELPASTRTAAEAAAAIGCEVGQIAKSLVFRKIADGEALLVITSGTNRVDTTLVGEQFGAGIEMGDAAFVRRTTGFAIGGVPPVGHATPLTCLVDADLMAFSEIWAAAGTPRAVFRLQPDDLLRITDGEVLRVS